MGTDSWSGWVGFAALLALIIGMIDFVMGLIAIIRGEYYAIHGQQLIIFDTTTWGWLTLLMGIAIVLIGLMLAPYTDRNPSNKPEDRKLAIALMTLFLMMCASLTVIGSFFRGEGFNFILPWRQGVHEIFDL